MPAEPDDTKYESLYELSRDAREDKDGLLRACCSHSFDDENESGGGPKSIADSWQIGECETGELERQAEKIVEQEIEEYIQSTQGKAVNKKDQEGPSAPPKLKRPLTQSEALPDLPLEIGDHVYQWRSFAGMPHVFQVRYFQKQLYPLGFSVSIVCRSSSNLLAALS